MWQCGYAECDITPQPGHAMMAGYGVDRIATGSLSPLIAQAMVLEDREQNRFAWVTADVIGFDRTTTASIRTALESKLGLPPAHVVLCPSHTHWGPATLLTIGLACGPLNPWYVFNLESKVQTLVAEAAASLSEASLAFGTVQARIGHSRRLPEPDGSISFNPHPPGYYDTHTPILHIQRHGDPEEITVVSHACHPTSIGVETRKWSADYPGYFRTAWQKRRGPRSRAMFVMGCGGDAKVTHRTQGRIVFSESPRHSRNAGQKMAKVVSAGVESGQLTSLDAPIRAGMSAGGLTLQHPLPERRLREIAAGDGDYPHESMWARQMLSTRKQMEQLPCETTVWQCGDQASFVFLESEVCSAFGPAVRELSNSSGTFVAAYTNAVDGYIPTRQIVLEGGYEGGYSHKAYLLPAPFRPEVEAEFLGIVGRAIAKAGGASRGKP